MTADALVAASTAAVGHYVHQTNVYGSAYRTLSVYAKSGEVSWLSFWDQITGARAYFDLTGVGAVGTITSAVGATIEPVGSGWYRCSLTALFTSYYTFAPASANGGVVYASGDAVSAQVYIWGAQLTNANHAGPYVATTTAAYNVGNIRNITQKKQNLLVQSQTFDNASWNKSFVTVSPNVATAPDGTMTADGLVATTTDAQNHYVRQASTGLTIAGQDSVFSFYAKAGYAGWVLVTYASTYTSFDLVNGVMGTTGAGITASITPVGNGWCFCQMKSQLAMATFIVLNVATANNTLNYSAADTSAVQIYFWQAQLVNAGWAGPLVATTSATVNTGNIRNIPQKRQNLLLQSQTFESASWTKGAGVTATDNQAVAPDGTMTAALLDWSAAANDIGISQTTTYNSYNGVIFSVSFWVRAVSGTATFDLYVSGGAITAGGTVQTVGETWTKVTTVLVSNHPNTQIPYLRRKSSSGNVYIWGAQYVNSNDTQGYVPTTTAKISSGFLRLVARKKQNLITYSQTFENAAWIKSSLTIADNQAIAPDGTATAALVTDSASLLKLFTPTATSDVGSIRTFSLYAKAGTLNWLAVYINSSGGGSVNFNLSTGTLGTVNAHANLLGYAIEPSGNGWYRCSVTLRRASAGFTERCYLANADGGISYVGDGTGTLYVWGGQSVYGNAPGPYTPTTTAAVNTGNIRSIAQKRQNLMKYSQVFQNAAWVQNSAPVITDNAAIAPDGTMTAASFTSADAVASISQNVGSPKDKTVYTGSLWMKADAACTTLIEITDNSDGNPSTQTFCDLTTEWQRFSVTGSGVAGMNLVGFIIGNRSGSFPTTRTLYIWGAQVTESNDLGPYTPTVASAVNTGNIRNAA